MFWWICCVGLWLWPPSTGVRPAEWDFRPPLVGAMSSRYGMRVHPLYGALRHHHGIDIAAPLQTPVYAAKVGRVRRVGWGGGYGLTVEVEHGFGWSTRYAHLDTALVAVGQTVVAGQEIARVGATGAVTGPHLHFEVHYGHTVLNPLAFLRPPPSPSLADWLRARLRGVRSNLASNLTLGARR